MKSSGVKRIWLKSSSCSKTILVTNIVFETHQHYLLASTAPRAPKESPFFKMDKHRMKKNRRPFFFRCSAACISGMKFVRSSTMILSLSAWPAHAVDTLFSSAERVQPCFHRCRLCLFFPLRRFQHHASRKHRSLLWGAGPGAQPMMCFPGKQMVKTCGNEL